MEKGTAYNTNNVSDKYQFILKVVSCAILIESPDHKIEFVNQAYCDLFKIRNRPESLIGTDCKQGSVLLSNLFKNPTQFLLRINQILCEQSESKNELLALRDGRTLERNYTPILIDDGIYSHLWTYKDVTEQHYTDVKLQEQKTFYEQVLNIIPSDFAIFSKDHRYLFVNEVGVDNPEIRRWVIGRTDFEYCLFRKRPKEIAELRRDNFIKAIHSRKEISWEEEIADTSGKPEYFLRTYFPVLNDEDDDEIETIVGYGINISSIREKEKLLQKARENYLHTLNGLSEVILLANEDLGLNFINDAWNESISKGKAEKGTNIFELVPINKYDFYKQVFSVLSGSANKLSGKLDLKDKDGKERWFQYSLHSDLSEEGKEKGIVASLNDITDKVHLEQNLLDVVKRQKELNDLKSAFVNMVSHELRTPLTVISSGAVIIQMMLEAGKSKEDIEQYITQILNEVEKMTEFMNDLLMVSKIEAGKIDFKPEKISIKEFLQTLVKDHYSPWKDGRSISLHYKGTERDVNIDTMMMKHVMQNLIENAFKYSAGKPIPEITIHFSNTHYSISVIDSGIGIPDEDIKNLFTSFTRGKNTSTISGTGIGLVLVKYFVEQHKGSVAVKSKLNKGTVFTVKIPYDPA